MKRQLVANGLFDPSLRMVIADWDGSNTITTTPQYALDGELTTVVTPGFAVETLVEIDDVPTLLSLVGYCRHVERVRGSVCDRG